MACSRLRLCLVCVILIPLLLLIAYISTYKPASLNILAAKEDLHQPLKPISAVHNQSLTVNRTQKRNSEFEFRKFPINNPKLCQTANLAAFLWVQISVGDFEVRTYLREHWLNPDLFVKPQLVIAFMVGLPENDETQNLLKTEAEKYGDIIQGDFVDSYENQTLKNVAAIEWISKYCMTSTYTIKTDSDVFINIVPIMEYLLNTGISDNTFACYTLLNEHPLRYSKYKVSEELYPAADYPGYCRGVFYIHRTSMVERYLHAAMTTPFTVWIQDVFMTGIVREAMINVTLTSEPFEEWSTHLSSFQTQYTDCQSEITKYIIHRNDHHFQEDLDLTWAAALQRLPPTMKAKVNVSYLKETAKKFKGCGSKNDK